MVDVRRTLVLFRHAKSAWPDPTSPHPVQDRDRTLNERGKRDAPAAGHWLNKHVPGIETVLCSPARRARETWELAAPEVPASPTVRYVDDMYEATPDTLVHVLRELPSVTLTVALVGHNPTLSELVRTLTNTPLELKTSGIALLRTQKHWSEVGPGWAQLETSAAPRG